MPTSSNLSLPKSKQILSRIAIDQFISITESLGYSNCPILVDNNNVPINATHLDPTKPFMHITYGDGDREFRGIGAEYRQPCTMTLEINTPLNIGTSLGDEIKEQLTLYFQSSNRIRRSILKGIIIGNVRQSNVGRTPIPGWYQNTLGVFYSFYITDQRRP